MNKIDQFRGRDELHLHINWLDAFMAIASKSDVFQAVVLLGSFAKGEPDRVSDLDLIIFVDRKDLKAVAEKLFKDPPFELIHSWIKEFSTEHIFGRFIYGNFVSAEIHILSLENDFKIRRPFVVLKDPKELLQARLEEGAPPRHEDFDALGAGSDGLGWELFDMFKWWQRGKSKLVKEHLKKVVARLEKE